MKSHKIEITLEGNKYTLSFDMNAFALMEDEFGKDMSEITNAEIFNTKSAKEIIRLIYIFANSYHPDLTKQDIGRMIHIGNVESLIDQIQEGYEKSMPDEPEKKQKKSKANAKPSG